MKKFITVKTAAGDVQLRLTLGAQKVLREKHPEANITDLVMSAATDSILMSELLDASIHFSGNENPKSLTGEDLYDELVDAGYAGHADFAELALSIARGAGIIDEKQRLRLVNLFRRNVEKVFDELDDDATEKPESDSAQNGANPT